MLVFNRNGQLLLGERNNEAGSWQFPQGGVEDSESLEENVIREVNEELGISKKVLGRLIKLKATHEYDFAKIPDYAKGRWRGQSQTFWLVEFLGVDSDINVATEHPEFINWRWCDPNEISRVADDRRRPGYEKPVSEFISFLKS